MALQQCLSGGRRMLRTSCPLRSSRIRHLLWSVSPQRTQKWSHSNAGSVLTISISRSPRSSNGKWLGIKTCSSDYSQLLRGRGSKESSGYKDDSEHDGDDDDHYDEAEEEKREGKENIDKDKIKLQVNNIFASKKEMSSAEWKDVIKLMELENSFVTARSCDAIVMKKCLRDRNYLLGTSYLHYLEQEGREPNLSTLGTYLQLCAERVDQCGVARVLEYYNKLMSQAKVLDVRLLKNAIVGVTVTQEWRQALDLLPRHKKIAPVCSVVYSAIITAAFRTGDHDLAWQLFDIMRQEGQEPKDTVILEYMRQCNMVEDRSQKETMLLTMLHKLEPFETFPSVVVAKEVTRLCREGLGWSAHFLRMPRSGKCPACKHQMEIKGVNEDEFRELQEEFVSRVLMGSDIFRSTHPEEWQEFQMFVEKRRPFSVVVDGLNASYILGQKSIALRQQSLQEVVEQSLAQHPDSRVLVLGRQHMRTWVNRKKWDMKRVCIYTLNNMSKDDGFFLYAALQSGLGTKFITSDMLRDHLFRLRERHLQDAFRRWQRTHQVMAFSASGHIRLLAPPKFSTVTQQQQINKQEAEEEQQQEQQQRLSSQPQSRVLSSWHVPYDDGKPRQSYELPTTWMCLHPTLSLSPPFPACVSLDPLIHTPSSTPESVLSPHGSDTARSFLQRHQHRMITPMNDYGGGGRGAVVDDRDVYNSARNGRPRRRDDGGSHKSTRFRKSEYDVDFHPRSFPPPKAKKRFAEGKKSSQRLGDVKLRALFDMDER